MTDSEKSELLKRLCWECPKCGDVIPYSAQLPKDHNCTKNKDTNASMIAHPAGHYTGDDRDQT